MKLVVFVLNNVDLLEDLLIKMAETGITGATILDSTGMATTLAHTEEDIPAFSFLRKLCTPEREQSKTILIALEDGLVGTLRKIITEVTGGLDKPNTGVLFSLPIDLAEGMVKQ